MELQEIVDRLNVRFPGSVKSLETALAGDPFLVIDPPRMGEVALFLRDDPALSYEWLMCLSGVDYPPDRIEVVYHLSFADPRSEAGAQGAARPQ